MRIGAPPGVVRGGAQDAGTFEFEGYGLTVPVTPRGLEVGGDVPDG